MNRAICIVKEKGLWKPAINMCCWAKVFWQWFFFFFFFFYEWEVRRETKSLSEIRLGEAGGGQLAKHGQGPVPFWYKYHCVELFLTRLCLLTPNHCPLSCKSKANCYARTCKRQKFSLDTGSNKVGTWMNWCFEWKEAIIESYKLTICVCISVRDRMFATLMTPCVSRLLNTTFQSDVVSVGKVVASVRACSRLAICGRAKQRT